ncbi:hypothetical protein GCM10025862_36810 [Arsenicicoccus piscis]|uniref:Uncharacterized protein n=1 Tax=Arsenicicoccus piscis TaxID=673954 RepID=A0ABQ6HVS0_9MICO|nr:hypothetical protein GCM10025862_36810 [Arsenicicoccus piscis]
MARSSVLSLGSRAMAWMWVMATGAGLSLGAAVADVLGGVTVDDEAAWPAGEAEPAGVAAVPQAARTALAARAVLARSTLRRGVLMRRS